jgi:preprotein translocase subunit SecD
LIGLLLVALFMILYYRLPGVLSVLALAIYTAISLALFKLFHITLTLAGIAGFILSIGMAVDAHVFIFERLKEELKSGKNLAVSVIEGFHRAWFSIRDSNASSLITCAILYWFGSSIIRGFAVTLSIGIAVSMFSAITITRQFLRLVSGWRAAKNPWLYGVSKKALAEGSTVSAQTHKS